MPKRRVSSRRKCRVTSQCKSTFRYLNAAGDLSHVRCHWIPVDGVKGQDPEILTHQSADVLFRELDDRLKTSPVEFELELEIGRPGDPLNDATALWPEDRERVRIGRLSVIATTTEEEIGDRLMNHDPTMLVDGIEATDDPILQIRRGVYEASAAQRSGGWQASRSQAEGGTDGTAKP
ncbi:catalase [Agrobacterium sp. 22-226-1]